MKPFYSDYLIDKGGAGNLVHDQFARSTPSPRTAARPLSSANVRPPRPKALTPLTEGVTPRRPEAQHEHHYCRGEAVRRLRGPVLTSCC